MSALPPACWLELPPGRRDLESPWLELQKFASLNCVSTYGLNTALRKESLEETQSPQSLSRLIGPRVKWLKDLRSTLSVQSDGFPDAAKSDPFKGQGHFVLYDRIVRYCPRCMEHWFHSSLFQVAAVERCPYHGCALSEQCPRCGKPMPEFSAGGAYVPLHCEHCGLPFHDDLSLAALFGTTDELEKILIKMGEVEQAVRSSFERHLRVGIETPRRWGNGKDLAQTYFMALWTLQNGLTRAPYLADVPGFCWGPCASRSASVVNQYLGCGLDEEDKATAEHLTQACRQVRAVDKYLRHKVSSICGHQQTPRLAFGCVYWHGERKFYLHVRPSDCACCATLVHWRATHSGLMMLLELLRGNHKSWLTRALRTLLGDVDPRDYALGALGRFSRSAVQVAAQLQCSASFTKHLFAFSRTSSEESCVELDRLWVEGFQNTLDPTITETSYSGVHHTLLEKEFVDRLLRELASVSIAPASANSKFEAAAMPRSLWYCELGSDAAKRSVGWCVGDRRSPDLLREDKRRRRNLDLFVA